VLRSLSPRPACTLGRRDTQELVDALNALSALSPHAPQAYRHGQRSQSSKEGTNAPPLHVRVRDLEPFRQKCRNTDNCPLIASTVDVQTSVHDRAADATALLSSVSMGATSPVAFLHCVSSHGFTIKIFG
jgi:hypothetical protein